MQIHHKLPKETKTKLLYIMGGTWMTKSMFDLDFPEQENSFCQLLNELGIETFTFDITQKTHSDVVEYCKHIMVTHNITNVMGYSYGCLPAIDLSNITSNLILLDPFSGIKIQKEERDGRLYYKSSDVKDIIDKHTYIQDNVKLKYLESLGNDFDVSNFPKAYSKQNFDYYTDWKIHRKLRNSNPLVIFTESSKPEIHKKFSTLKTKFFANSHWILLEEGRKPLSLEVAKHLKIPLL